MAKNHLLNDRFPKVIKNATSSSDGLMSAEDKASLDSVFEFGLLSPATPDKDGIMTKEDKEKLDSIDPNAVSYVHPDTHPATMITEDNTHRFVTDEQIDIWNSKVTQILATPTNNGLMSKEDKAKLDSIQEGATANTSVATQTANGLMSASDKKKLDSITSGATDYVHPDTHPATMIVEDATHRFVTDVEKTTWNALIDEISTLKSDYTAILEKLKTAVFYE